MMVGSSLGRWPDVAEQKIPRLTARKMKGGQVWYYYRTTTGGALPLGSDRAEALRKWADLEARGSVAPADGWLEVSKAYKKDALPGKAPKTQHEYELQLAKLDEAFGKARLPQIQPQHIRQYLDRRSAKVAGNREIALLSAVFNWARERGITAAPNPCAGVRRNREERREVYVTDEEFRILWVTAPPELQDALDLARLTGQREQDILAWRRADIRDGHLWVKPMKVSRSTGTRIGIEIIGELSQIITRILGRQRTATGLYLVQTNAGQRMTYAMLRNRFDDARTASGQTWQFRDLRPKAATDMDDVRAAQELLCHASEATTAEIYRRRRGQKVQPVGKKKGAA